MIYEIKDIYNYQKDHTTPMLSSFTSVAGGDVDFWKPYKDNYAYFDRIFMKKYRSWYPMDQDGEVNEIAAEFADDVKGWLMINDKRYSELFRIQSIADDEKYSLTDNVYEHEVTETAFGKMVTFNKGEQEIKDEGSTDYGLHETTDNKTLGYGEHVIETGVTENLGVTEKTIEDSTSAYNASGYSATDKSVTSTDAVENGTDTTVTDNEHEDTDNRTITSKAHKDETANTRTDGAREDTTEDSGTETVTRDRAGNVGIKDVAQILMDQEEMWVNFSFFELIFAEITRELLRGGAY